MTQARLMIPRKMNEPRHVTATINQATRGGVMALPEPERAWVIPWANGRFFGGVQSLIARVDMGNVAPSPNPSMTRKKSTAARLLTVPVNRVADAQIMPQTVSPIRAPNRSLTQPPMIWKMRYGYAKAQYTSPNCVLVRCRSRSKMEATVLTMFQSM